MQERALLAKFLIRTAPKKIFREQGSLLQSKVGRMAASYKKPKKKAPLSGAFPITI